MNWVAVGIASLVYYVIGAIWYLVFGNLWMAANGLTRQQLQRNMQAYAMAVVSAVLTCVVIAEFMNVMDLRGALSGAGLGLLAWLGFVFAPAANHNTFEGRRKILLAINQGYDLVGFLVAGAIIGALR
jgi:hypothetical protein